jgi:peptide/nickel transport system permease protein
LTKYVSRRLLLMLPSLAGISVAVFLLLRLIPGDVVDALIGAEFTLSPEARASLLRLLGLDVPIHVQYLTWVWAVLNGDLGRSLRSGQPVLDLLLLRLPITAELSLLALALSVVIAIPLGVVSAVHRNSRVDFLARLFGLLGLSLPGFWLATMLILVASLYFKWLPPIIFISLRDDPVGNLKQMLLPTISLAMPLMAVTMRLTRSAMLEVLRQDYVRTARAKGLRERVVVYRHALRNALVPVVTIVGIQMGHLLGGAVIIEQIFGLPGVGWMLLQGIYQRDYPVVQGGVLFVAVVFLFLNLFVDLLYAYLDPRIKYG